MVKSNIIYKDKPEVYATYCHPQSEDFLHYKSTIQIRDSGKQPIIMKLKFDGILPSYAELCRIWRWSRPDGQLKDMACRTLLLKLERAGSITLPPRQRPSTNEFRTRSKVIVPHQTEEIECRIHNLKPLQITQLSPRTPDYALFNCLLSQYHYLGHRTTVGENIGYLVRDCNERPVACLLFGSAAWKTAARDRFIGWDRPTRKKNLNKITNNTRFLILPLGKGSSFGQSCAFPNLAANCSGLDSQIRPSNLFSGDLRRSEPLSGNLLSCGQLDFHRKDARPDPQ